MAKIHETFKVYEVRTDQRHHNLTTIANVMTSMREQWILHKGIRLIVFKDEINIKDIGQFDFHEEDGYTPNFIKSGVGLAVHVRNWIEDNYSVGDKIIFEIYPIDEEDDFQDSQQDLFENNGCNKQ